MLVGIFVDTSKLQDIQAGIVQLQQWEAALNPEEAQRAALREILELETSRLLRVAHEHFGVNRFDLHQLAAASGEDIRKLHGLTGSLGRACENRNVEVWDRHGGQPLILSVRQEVAQLLEEEPS